MITTNSSAGWTNITVTFGGSAPEPPPAPAAEPARPRTPPGAPPVLAARKAADGAWEVPARPRGELVALGVGA